MTDWMAAIGADFESEQQAAADAHEQQQDHAAESSYDTAQIAELCKASLNWLAGVAMPTKFMFGYPTVLLTAWSMLITAVSTAKDFSQIALGIPRGHAKTTVMKLLVLYCILFTTKKFILVVSSTQQNAENFIRDVEGMLNELNIKRIFGDWSLGSTMNRQDLKQFGFRGRNITLMAIGQGGSLRGVNLDNERPDLMIFEDIQSAEDAKSDVISESILTWMLGTAMKAKSPFGCTFVFCANMYPGKNSILRKLKDNRTWVKFISGAILADGTALWPELRSLESLLQEFDNDIAAGHPEIFLAEVMNDTEAGINTKTDLTKIKPWPWHIHENPQGKFIILDPSGDKHNSDDCVIGQFDVYDGVPGLRKVISEILSPGNIIRRALLLGMETGTRLIAVESVAFQASLLYWFDVICTELGITGFTFVEIYPGGKSKNSRIATMLKSLTASPEPEIYIHHEVRSIVTHQISQWNPLKKNNVDGILDVIHYAPRVLAEYGEAILTDNNLELIEATAALVSGESVTNPF
jgi:hypothetical protein